jgi:polyvinyl alcohol dehydrogenase (cytochrome)
MNTVRSLGAALTATLAVAVAFAAAPASAATAPCTERVATGDWPSYGHDVANTRTQPVRQGIGPADVTKLQPAWTFSTSSTGDGGNLESTPVVSGGCVYIGSTNAVAYALNATTGKVVWQRKLPLSSAGFGGGIVGAPAVDGKSVIYLVNQNNAPYAVALDRSTGGVVWQSKPYTGSSPNQLEGYTTNASPIVANGLVVAGYSSPEGDPNGSGGFALIDAHDGTIVKITPTIPLADQAKGYAGGGLWSSPAYDPATKLVYWGAGNPNNKGQEHPYTNSILKIDLNRDDASFGEIVGYYHGNVDQYAESLETLSHTPACSASDVDGAPYPLDDPACGQIDLDFGDSANLFTASDGTKLVGDLQKSGVYHAAHADSMKPAWTALVGVSCQACNAAASAFDGKSVVGAATPGGQMYSLGADKGAVNWLAPIGDGIHYQGTSVADGVVWTTDGPCFLDAFDAKSGQTLMRRPMCADTKQPAANATSAGVAIAQKTVFAEWGGAPEAPQPGYVAAYRLGG